MYDNRICCTLCHSSRHSNLLAARFHRMTLPKLFLRISRRGGCFFFYKAYILVELTFCLEDFLMKAKQLFILAGALVALAFAGCKNDSSSDDDDDTTTATTSTTGIYADFYNYPTGKKSTTGLLKLTNEVNSAVLVFTDSVSASNYVCTIPALSSVQVALTAGKFYSIVAVTKSAYEEDQTLAAQSSVLAYYSSTQAYTVSVSPENLTGSATWIFNNNTNYWVSVEKTDNSGETYAVIAPNAKRVSVPVQTNTSYDYKVVYKKQLKYNGNVIAVSNKTAMEENDTASFLNITSFTTDLNGSATSDDSDLAPTVQFINNTGKTLRVYNGQVQLTDSGITSDDYTLATGITAFFSGFTGGTSATTLNVRSVAWTGALYCDGTDTLQNGNVYTVTLTIASGSGTTSPTLNWAITSTGASDFYTEE